MTTLYFIRHARPDFSVHDDMIRPLTPEGEIAAQEIVDIMSDVEIHQVYSSPYKRSYDTVKPLAQARNLDITVVSDFRERKISNNWIEDFNSFALNQWENFDYKLEEGESLSEVQSRNIKALELIVNKHKGQTLVIGTHGTALSTIIHYYDSSFDYQAFENIKGKMPWIFKMCILEDGQVSMVW